MRATPLNREFSVAARRLAGLSALQLGWPPNVFWSATPAELAAIFDVLAGAGATARPPDTQTIRALMEQHPDG